MKELLQQLAAKKKEAAALDCKDADFDTKYDKIAGEIADIKAKINEEKKKALQAAGIEGDDGAGLVIGEIKTPMQEPEKKELDDILASKEYHKDFYHLLQGKMSQGEFTKKYGEKVLTATGGAAIIPTTTAKEVIGCLEDFSGVYEVCGKSNVRGAFKIPRKTGSSAGVVATDGTAVAEGTITLDVVAFDAKLIQKWVEVSLTLGIQSVSSLETLVVEDIKDAIAETFAAQLANGPGTGINATGILIDSVLTNEVEITTAALGYDDLVKLSTYIKKRYRKNASCIMSSNTFYKHVCTIKSTTGVPLIKPNQAIEGGFEMNIFGKKVILDDEYPDFGTAAAEGKRFLTYGDHKRGYHCNIPLDIAVKNTGENQKTGGTIFRGDMIFDAKVKDPDALVTLVQNNGTGE